AQTAKAHGAKVGALARRQWKAMVVHHEKYAVPLDDRPFGGKVQGHDLDILQMDVLPNIQLGPIGNGEYTNTLALVRGGVVETPELGALILRVPAMLRRAKGEDSFLGAAFLLVAPRAAECGGEFII